MKTVRIASPFASDASNEERYYFALLQMCHCARWAKKQMDEADYIEQDLHGGRGSCDDLRIQAKQFMRQAEKWLNRAGEVEPYVDTRLRVG